MRSVCTSLDFKPSLTSRMDRAQVREVAFNRDKRATVENRGYRHQ